MQSVKKFSTSLAALVFLLLVLPGMSQAKAIQISVSHKGSGSVNPSGKVVVTPGQNQAFTFQPGDANYEVGSVKVDGKLILPTPSEGYSFGAVDKSHRLQVTFAKKSFEIWPVVQNHQMGSLLPAKAFMAPHGSNQTLSARPQKGYAAALRVDGVKVATGAANKTVKYVLKGITGPHSYGVVFEAVNNAPVTAVVSVKAVDPNGLALHYRWKVSEGSIVDADHETTTWTLPTGPGVHFANVLVYNDKGGYASRRIAVSSDNLGTSSPVLKDLGQEFEPTTTFGKSYALGSVFLVAEATDVDKSLRLDRFVYLNDFNSHQLTLDGLSSDSQGRDVADYFAGYLTYPYSMFGDTHPQTNSFPRDHIVGSVRLADGSLCGTDDKFFAVNVAATATALDQQGKPLPIGNPVTVKANAYGDYALPWQADASQVLVECGAVAITVPVAVNRVADKAVLPFTGQPVISPSATSMTATIDNRSVGIFLPPQLQQPSDSHTSGDKFLAFKGIDSQQQACQYYKNIGAVERCDDQGNPGGTVITFDDWKRKMQMDPYAKAGAKDVEATYVNRIDLNLTRRHHAISYDDQAGAVAVSAGTKRTCALKADNTLACWGSNYYNSPPNGAFKQLSVGHSSSCGIRSEDSKLVCWGDDTLAPSEAFSWVDTGNFYNCGIKSADNSLVCWGSSDPVPLPQGSFSQVSVGGQYGCAIQNNGDLVCWGASGPASIPVSPGDSISQVSVGQKFTCAIKANENLLCWNNLDGSALDSLPPTGNYRQISVGGEHACGLLNDNTLACWGNNFYGQAIAPSGSFTQVSSGPAHNCAVKTDGDVQCWGQNDGGEGSPPDLKHRVAAYVCNHLGPKNNSSSEVDAVIDNALNDRNQVACVAMDYQAHNGGNPYVRFYVFAPNGQLSLSINLDGRQEKYVPGTCIACHGGDKYDGHYPGNGHGSPDVGAHFLPYDTGNFLFSSKAGLSKADQQAAIHQLNKLVLQTNPTSIERNLINAWYQSGSDTLDEDYWPNDWKRMAPAAEYVDAGIDLERVYKDVNARYCRTCHVAINRDGMRIGGRGGFDNPEYVDSWYEQTVTAVSVCGKLNSANPERKSSPMLHNNHSMPNSLVTFNLLWNDAHAVSLLRQMLGADCSATNPDPELNQ